MHLRKRVAIIVDYLETEYTQRAVKGAHSFLKKHNMELVVFPISTINAVNFNYDYQNLAVASHVNSSNVDGLIFLTCTQLNNVSLEYLRMYLKSFAPLPVVSVGCEFEDIPSITISCRKSMCQLVEHLIVKHNKRNFALMSLEGESQEAREREDAFRQTLKKYKIPFDESKKIYGGFTYDTAIAALRDYREKKGKFDFDAIVALNDEMAFSCLDILKMYNEKVPQRIIVTGFDDETRAACVTPSLTSINQNVEKQTEAAAKMLYKIINGETPPIKKTIVTYPVFRQTCGCIPLNDKNGTGIGVKGNVIEASVKNILDFGLKKWYANRNNFIQIIQHYSTLQAEITLDELSQRINSDLISYGISAAAICLFETPVTTERFDFFNFPSKTYVFSAFDEECNFIQSHSAQKVFFDPKNGMIPEGIFLSMDKMQVCTLFNNSIIYGYIIYRPGDYDSSIYSMVCKMISSSIANAVTFSQAKSMLKKLEKDYNKICEVSVTDELTGLLNRRGFISISSRILENAMHRKEKGLILFGDIDGLKKINDTHGHAAGDKAIKNEAEILKKTFRSSDAIARLSGDEFVILAAGLDQENFTSLKKRLQDYCASYNRDSGEPFTLSISIGAAPYGGKNGYNINSLLELADTALYAEKAKKYKRKGKNMKIDAKFYSEENRVYFLNGTELDIKKAKSIDGNSCKKNSDPENDVLYTITVSQELTGTEENANELFLAEFREWLKKLESKNSFAIIAPFTEKNGGQADGELITASFKHCARRIKDCENVIGFSIPGGADPEFFISELSEKHSHYIFFSSDENLSKRNGKIVKI
ncbi:substrate-binding and GGDEF domain-containing protein [Treponema sp.]|uniref:substrate-binding and GGDEF domain-containing protein n=1 Tax=Treponema sp. TaxID=166 RepID=UPI003F05E236